MNSTRHICCFVIILFVGIALNGMAYGDTKRLATRHFIIDFSDISDRTADVVARDAEQAFRDVTSLLGIKNAGLKIRIKIGKKYPFPRSRSDKRVIEVPANRLGPHGALGGPRGIRGRGPTFWHGVANVVAPTGHAHDAWGRFLQEGMGGYVQAKFGGKLPAPWPSKVYPTMGRDLDVATVRLAGDVGLLSLADASRHVNDRKLTRTRQLAWLQAASFVRYLVERKGLDEFKRWYGGQSFKEAYGVDLAATETEWKKFILGIKS